MQGLPPSSSSTSTVTPTAAATTEPSLWSLSVRTVGGGGSFVPSPSSSRNLSVSSSSVRAAAAATSDDDANEEDASATAAVETTAVPATPAGPSANNDSDAPSSVSGEESAAVSPSTPSSIGNDGHYAPFVVQIDPNDSVAALHDKIYDQTGLSVERQRLIYRGKIISTGSAANASANGGGGGGGGVVNINTAGGTSTSLGGANNDCGNTNHTSINNSGTKKRSGRVCDVAGLGDGHTIHLVPRPVDSSLSTEPSPFTSSRTRRAGGIDGAGGEEGAAAAAATSDALASAILGDGGSASDAGGAALLAALLGLGSLGSGLGTRRARAEDEGPEDDDDLSLAAALDEPGPDPVGSGIAQLLTGGTALTGTSPRVGRRARRAQNSASSAATPARPSYVLTTEVIEERQRQDLGSLEPVRQGLLTTHTILHGAGLGPTSSLDIENSMPDARGSTGLPPRRFFRGQWIDCLDTVNSWLEATVVDIASPEDVLGIRPAAMHPEHYNEEANPHRNRRGGARGVVRAREGEDGAQTRGDPIVGSTDWDGRRMLLLEPDPDAENTEPIDRPFASGGQDLSDYRERPSNVANDVQLLLVHYNGWPRRWNEWIRSDSTRIRPFRSRTMHGSAVQQQSGRRQQRQQHAGQERVGACPSIRAAFHASPSTQIVPLSSGADPNNAGDSDASERIAALSELRTVLRHVDALIESCVEEHQEKTNNEGIDANQGDVVLNSDEVDDEIEDEQNSEDENFFGEDDSFLDVDAEEEGTRNLPWQATPLNIESDDVHPTGAVSPSLSAVRSLDPAVRLRTLAPLLDRVGRVCVSISPHVTKLAETCSTQPRETGSDDVDTALLDNNIEDVSTWGEEHVASDDSIRHAVNDIEESIGLYDDVQDDLLGASAGNGAVGENDGSLTGNETTGLAPSISAIDWRNDEPDMVDFSNAAVHEAPTPETASPTRGARSRSIGGGGTSSSVSDNIASVILAAALAGSDNTGSGTGPRLVNLGGNRERAIGAGGGGGIDIHVHMLVTGATGARASPTTPTSTALGRAANTGGVTSGFLGEASTTSTPQQPRVPIAVPVDDEDDDLFSNLYTETPEPATWSASPELNHGDDDSSSPPSTFADYEDEEEGDDIDVGVDSGGSFSGDEPPVLSEIESDGEDNDDGVGATNEPVSPSTPTAGRDGSPTRSPPSPRRSPLSRLFRRSRRRR